MKFTTKPGNNYYDSNIEFVRIVELIYDNGVYRKLHTFHITRERSDLIVLSEPLFNQLLDFINEDSKMYKKELP